MIETLQTLGAIAALSPLVLVALAIGETDRQRLHSRRCALIRKYRETEGPL